MEAHPVKVAGLTGKVYKVHGTPRWQFEMRDPATNARKRISLGTQNLDMALAKAKAILSKTGADGIAALKGYARRSSGSTVGAACDHYLATSTVPYRSSNVNCLYRLIRAALGTKDLEKVRALPLSRLNRKLVADYLKKATVANITKKSSLAGARAIFARRNDWEGFDGLPDMGEFRDACTRTGLKTDLAAFQPLPKDVLTKMEQATKRHGGAIRRAWLLSRYLGLRPREIAGMRKTWIEERAGQHFLCVRQRPNEGFSLKTGSRGERDIGIPPAMATELLACNDHAIPGGTPYMRYNWLMRVFNNFLREFMPDRDQLLYTLRKQAGSDWLVATGKISLVSKLLGHTSASVTLRHYATWESSVTLPEGLFEP